MSTQNNQQKKVVCNRCLFSGSTGGRNEERFVPEDKHIARYGSIIVAPFKKCDCELTLEAQTKTTEQCDCGGESTENVKKRVWQKYSKLEKYFSRYQIGRDKIIFHLKACTLCMLEEDGEFFWYYENGWCE